MAASPTRSFQFFNGINATAPPRFDLDAGVYGLTMRATVWGTATLQKLLPDGTTWVAVLTAFAADGYQTVQLPAGKYRLLLAGITARSR